MVELQGRKEFIGKDRRSNSANIGLTNSHSFIIPCFWCLSR